uniref:Uncharacterized protein n=1 Tax=viral metagenome TaxID=1070528 RepID=A0A6M3KVE0_9ZZZZ
MSMIISQEFMESNVINPMARRLAEIEKKIDLLKSDIELLVKDFDKVIKNTKKVK